MANGQNKTQSNYLKAYQALVGPTAPEGVEDSINNNLGEFAEESDSLVNKNNYLKAYEKLVGKPADPKSNPETKKDLYTNTAFNNSIGTISLNTKNALSNFYNTDNVEVIADGGVRSMEQLL